MRRTNRYRQAVDASQFDKAFSFLWIGQECTFGVNAHVIFNTAEAAQFCFHAAIPGVAEVDNRFHQLHVLGKREVAAVDHRAAHACVDFTANIIQRFVVVEMQCQRHVIGRGIGATQGVDLFQRDMLKGTWCPGEDHRRSHFTAHFEDRLDRLGVMDVKGRHRVAIGLGVL